MKITASDGIVACVFVGVAVLQGLGTLPTENFMQLATGVLGYVGARTIAK